MKKFCFLLAVSLALLSAGCTQPDQSKPVAVEFTINGNFNFGNSTYGQSPATAIWLVGDFNGWQAPDSRYALTKNAAGIYSITILLDSGSTAKFKYFVATEKCPGGLWWNDMQNCYDSGFPISPAKTDVSFAPDGYTGYNAVISVN